MADLEIKDTYTNEVLTYEKSNYNKDILHFERQIHQTEVLPQRQNNKDVICFYDSWRIQKK